MFFNYKLSHNWVETITNFKHRNFVFNDQGLCMCFIVGHEFLCMVQKISHICEQSTHPCIIPLTTYLNCLHLQLLKIYIPTFKYYVFNQLLPYTFFVVIEIEFNFFHLPSKELPFILIPQMQNVSKVVHVQSFGKKNEYIPKLPLLNH